MNPLVENGQPVRNTSLWRLSLASATDAPFCEVFAGDLFDVCAACRESKALSDIPFVPDFVHGYDGVPGTKKKLLTSEVLSLVTLATIAKPLMESNPVRDLLNQKDELQGALEATRGQVVEARNLASSVLQERDAEKARREEAEARIRELEARLAEAAPAAPSAPAPSAPAAETPKPKKS